MAGLDTGGDDQSVEGELFAAGQQQFASVDVEAGTDDGDAELTCP
ncbi:hypothetical protein [Streptomyces sp. NPDC001250]